MADENNQAHGQEALEEKPPQAQPQPDAPPPQAQQQPMFQPQAAPMQHQHHHGFIGFGMDPNWGMHGQQMHHAGAGQGYQLPPGAPMESSLLPPGVPPGGSGEHSSDMLEQVLGVFPCVRLRGLPYNASVEDVLIFFQGLVVLDIVVVASADDERKGTGEAFVILGNHMDFQMALQRDRQNMGHRYIEVFQGRRSDYYAAIAAQFFQNKENLVDADRRGEHVMPDEAGGGPVWGGVAAVPAQTLNHPASMQQARPQGAVMPGNGVIGETKKSGAGVRGGQGIRPDQGSMGHMGTRAPSHRGGGIREGEHTGYLRMRGLPFSASKEEVIGFFKGYNTVDESICLTVRSDGRATGEGYVAFMSPDDAKEAMSLHRNTMGSRYIELFISNEEEHTRAMSRTNNR
eukprot:CAMPEP_0113539654 /NCGR_PEP_ID=MMETSP0015_2-20120614/8046_1 /TAXON_ID=2838 /ORGANISM="Odontella" /LENGTH=400 /DNA_ID=CAMNT_0000439373 /DNA_START=42 /DNA_END=1244 /DNA_ORIENTATION=+ /assembly_acc=CAM_ASM_000160